MNLWSGFIAQVLNQPGGLKDVKDSFTRSIFYLPDFLEEDFYLYLAELSQYNEQLPLFCFGSLPKKLKSDLGVKGSLFKVGETLNLSKLKSQLTGQYKLETVSRVIAPGQVSFLGDTITIWIKFWIFPVRMELFDDEIERISIIDPGSLSVLKTLPNFWLPDSVYLKEAKLDLIKFTPSVGGAIKSSAPRLVQIRISPYFDSTKPPFFKPVPMLTNVTGQITTKLRIKLFLDFHQRYIGQEKYKLAIATDFPEQIESFWQALVKQKKIKPNKRFQPMIVKKSLPKGFILDSLKQVVLTDYELLGSVELQTGSKGAKTKSRTKSGQSWQNLIKEVKVGDYVVHEDHGIGLFKGIKRMTPDPGLRQAQAGQAQSWIDFGYQPGQVIDYLEIKYKGKDRLYVPIYATDRLTKYINSAGTRPRLTGLKSGFWNLKKKRAQKAVEEIAQDLLKIYALRSTVTLPAFEADQENMRAFIETFPYQDTPDQKQATWEIMADLAKTKPMDRLLVGDVGFGKTEVAVRAALAVVMAGRQVAVLAPTTILVAQHYKVFKDRLEKHGVRVASISRLKTKKEQNQLVKKLKNKEIDLIIGTHRLLSKDIDIKDLGLLIIDEEQRFGVKQKEKLKGARIDTHVLSMSATPIPRSLNISLLGIRDISIINTPPPGRMPIKNKIQAFKWSNMIRVLRQEVDRGGQTYLVYNRVAKIDKFGQLLAGKLESAWYDRKVLLIEDLEQLENSEEKNGNGQVKIAIAHGQMSPYQLARVMEAFYNKEIDILLCSTIIENGLDMPNVNSLIVVNAQQFGLAQLYQLRGRIGRGERQAYALFLIGEDQDSDLRQAHLRQAQLGTREDPLKEYGDYLPTARFDPKPSRKPKVRKIDDRVVREQAYQRLSALKNAERLGAGMDIAMADMSIRGVGNILGKSQHGFVDTVGFALYQEMLEREIEKKLED